MTRPDEGPTPVPSPDEVVLLEDLAPRRDIGGGRKITLGERVPDAGFAPPADPAASGR